MPEYLLGIESSCDDTSAAVIQDGYLLSNVIASQQVHKEYGGVVPELASRAHEQNIVPVVSQALQKAGIGPGDLSAIAFTRGPGLLGSLLVGTSFAKALGIDRRIVAEEPFSETTNIYNRAMREALPPAGIDCMILPRFGIDGVPVSASAVRQAIHDGDWDTLEKLVPPTTYAFFRSPEAAPVIARIRGTADVIHH